MEDCNKEYITEPIYIIDKVASKAVSVGNAYEKGNAYEVLKILYLT